MISYPNMQLRHTYSVMSGATPLSGNAAYWDGDIPWITPEDLSDRDSYWLADTRRKITCAGYEASGTTLAPANSVVLSKRAPIGRVAILRISACSNQGCFLLTQKVKSDSRFFYYWLLLNTSYLESLGSGSTFMELGMDDVKSMRVPAFTHERQSAIADYLDRETARIDTLIAAKERLLNLLAEKRQALIDYAIVHGFDSKSVTHDLDGFAEGEEYAYIAENNGSTDKAQVGTFSTKPLKYFVTLRRSPVIENGSALPYVGLENIEARTGKIVGDMKSVDMTCISKHENDGFAGIYFESGDVLFGKLRPYLAKAWLAEFPGRCTTEALVMTPRTIEPRFLRYVCISSKFIETVDAATFGSKMPRAEWGFIGNMRVPVPDRTRQRAIADRLDRETIRIDELAVRIRRGIALLTERRNAVIFGAVNGRTDVRSAA